MKNNVISLLTILFAVISVSLLGSKSLHAQEDPTFSVAGTIDTYYRSAKFAPGTSFANDPGFSIGMANVVLSYEGEKHGFVADFVYGPRGADAVFGSTEDSSQIINQLYAYYNFSDSFTVTVGNFNTFLGYEVISPAANFNYSTSYMFSYGPFSHTGLKLDFTLSDDVTFMAAIMNPTDMTEANYALIADENEDGVLDNDPSDTYTYGLQLGLFGQYINFLGGTDYSQIDFTGGVDITDGFFLGVNATSTTTVDSDTGFSGVALYPQVALTDSFSLGARYEYFESKSAGIIGVGDEDNTSFTITGSYTSGNFILKPEFRVDNASDKFYLDNDAALTDSLASFVVAAIYSF
jgi:hypothetical protein